MSLVRFPPSMTSSSSANETSPLLPGYADSFPENRTTSHARRVAPLVCVIGAVFLERTTYYGVLANLVYYLMKMEFSAHQAVEIVLVFTGLAWFMSTIGGFIGDAFSGRYNAIWGSLLIYLLGGAVLVASAYFQGHSNFKGYAKGYCLFALLIISVGEGAYKANISAFGAEQVEGHTDSVYRNYFNWYYWSINLGCLFAYSGIAYLQMAVGYLPGFIVPLCCIFLATIVFCCGRKVYTVNSPTGYFRKVYRIVKEARSRRHDDESPNNYYPGLEDYMPRTSWLDRAMIKYGGSYLDCEVEEVKILGKVLLVFLVLIPYWSIYYQMNSTFLLQGIHMKIGSGHQIIFPPSWLSLIDVIAVLVLIPIMDRLVYPSMDRRGWDLPVQRRICIGFVFAVLSMFCAGFLEQKRWPSHGNITQQIGNQSYNASTVPIYWQVPQYCLIGISEVFASVGGLEFAYMYAPKHMQGFVMGLFYLVQSVGSWLGVALFVFWNNVIPHQSVRSDTGADKDFNLEAFFFLLGGVMFVTLVVFVIVSRRVALPMKYRKRVTFVVGQKPDKSDPNRRTTLVQAPIASSDH